MGFILLDTCILSEARRSSPQPDVLAFLKRTPNIAVPPTVIFEMERGALNLARTDPVRSAKFHQWLLDFLATDVWIPAIDAEVKILLAALAMTPDLQQFWRSGVDPPEMVFACDPEIAAVSIAYGIPIATANISDFLLINRHYPLPGLYDPLNDYWHVKPPEGWSMSADSAPEEQDWRITIGPAR